MNENAFASIVQARPCPTFGRPVHRRGSPHRLRPGTSPHALRIPSRDGHPALQRVAENVPDSLWPARHYPRFRIWRPSSERPRDFNPPEQRAAQHTLCPCPTPPQRACGPSGLKPSPAGPIFAGHQGGLPVLVQKVSRRVWGLRLRRAAPRLALAPRVIWPSAGVRTSAP